MKLLVERKLILGFLFLIAQSVSAQGVLDSGLVAYFPFSHNANDATGHGHDGQVVGARLTLDRFGRDSMAYDLNGSTDYIQVADDTAWAFGRRPFTILLWIKFKVIGDYYLIGQSEGPGPTQKWILTYWASVLRFHRHFPEPFGSNPLQLPWMPAVNRWCQIAVTREGNQFFLYVDSTLQVAAEDTHAVPNSNAPLLIGNAEGTETRFNGLLDDVRIYHRALTIQEIKALYFEDPTGFHSRGMKNDLLATPVAISEFRLFNQPLYRDLSENQTIELSYADNFFSFVFAAHDYSKPWANQYAYKMEGFNKDWVYCGTERTATYTHLDPGEYIFRVKGTNSEGLWYEKGLSVRVVITPPWWKTLWFQGSVGLALLFVFGAGIRQISTRKLRKQVAELHQTQLLEEERSRISRNMHDDLGARLTELSLGIDLIKPKLGDTPLVKIELDKISDTTREIVGTFDEIVWTVNPENDSLDNVATALSHYVSKYLSNAHIRCRLDIPTILPERRILAETRHNILMVVKEAIHNIVKHAEATEVSVQVMFNAPLLEVVIHDNGKGFVPGAVSPFSDGLRNMKQRMEAIGGKFEVASEHGKGTVAAISVQLADT